MKRLTWILLLALSASAWAGPGHDHDHGESAAPPTAAALPRFSAASELFELVGVLDGQTLTLYLDAAPTNAPIPQADIELEIAGLKLKAAAQADGSFKAGLPKPLDSGDWPVIATVTTADDADLLAGELHLHAVASDAQAEAAHGHGHWEGWAAGAAVLAVLAGFVALRRRQGGAA